MDNEGDFSIENPGKELNNPASEVEETHPNAVEYMELESKLDPNSLLQRIRQTDFETAEYKTIAKALQGKVADEPPSERSKAKLKPLLEIGFETSKVSSSSTVNDDQTDHPSLPKSTNEHHDRIDPEVFHSAEDFKDYLAKVAASLLQGKTNYQYESNDGRLTGQFFREVAAAAKTEGQSVLPRNHAHEGIINEDRQVSANLPSEIFHGLHVDESSRNQELSRTKPLSQVSNFDFSEGTVDDELVEAAKLLHEALVDEAKQNAAHEEFHSEETLASWVESLCEESLDEILQQTEVYADNLEVKNCTLAQGESSMCSEPIDKCNMDYENLLRRVPDEGTQIMDANYEVLSMYREATEQRLLHSNSSSEMHLQAPGAKESPEQKKTIEVEGIHGKIIGQSVLPAENSAQEEQKSMGAFEGECSQLIDECHNQHLQQKKIKLSIEDNFSTSWEDCNSTMAQERSSGIGNGKEGDEDVGPLSDFESGSVEVLDIVEMCNCDGNEHICNSLSQYRRF